MDHPLPPGYVSALRFRRLTQYYDAVVGSTARERTFKRALVAQARIAAAKARNVDITLTLDQGFSFSLPYASASFNRVLSSLFFHHLSLTDKQRTANEVFRVLKPGGEFHVADWGRRTNLLMRGLFL